MPHEIIDCVRNADGVAQTRTLATRYATGALEMLESLRPSVYRDAIVSIPEFILNRQL